MAIKLNTAGEDHLHGLIKSGKVDKTSAWSFDGADGDKLLGDKGDDWERYANIHLGEDTSADDMTKARWAYPCAKADGDAEKVYRSGVIAAKDRAGQQGDSEIEAAAGRLLDAIDGKKDAKSAGSASRPPRSGRADLPRIMTRMFDTPLMIAKGKLDVIMAALAPRLGLGAQPAVALAAWFDDGSDDDEDDDDDDEDKPYDVTPDGIAVICVDGTLVYKSSWLGALSGLTGYGDVRASLDAALADPAVKGILLQIDSYGGEVNGCFDLSDAVFAARQVKPVYGVAADDSYSAAYALLSACSKVFVSRTSGVGSIGVVALHVDQSGADKMEGLKYTYITAGAHKADGNPHGPLSDQAETAIQAEVDRVRGLFAGSVAKYRGLSADAVLATEAACYHGELAVAAGLADQVGTPDDAMAALRADLARAAAPVMGAIPAMPSPTSAAPAEVVDLSAMREKLRGEVRGELMSDAREIGELCKLAERQDLAAQFIAEGLSLAAVREKLQTLRADASDARKTVGHIQADAGLNTTQHIKDSWATAHAQAQGKAKEK
ncbi:MAG: S49 family peptidase [Alphaproteobacteria bacterium]|nr:S49 family peptidase [Alphaproteobacteria bacterium]MBL6939447.1 S49 family peptidase [Alphaproteobacteria bacterium]MBL7097072.1 S49 family peptidase [Alphaproteobacteria bacterium]